MGVYGLKTYVWVNILDRELKDVSRILGPVRAARELVYEHFGKVVVFPSR